MSNNIPGLPLMMALGALKKKDPSAFDALLKKLGVSKWSAIDPSRYGDAIATCSAATGRTFKMPDAEMSDDEVAAELGGNAEDDAKIRSIYEAAYGKAPVGKNLAAHATGKTTADKIESMAVFDQHARTVQHNAKAK